MAGGSAGEPVLDELARRVALGVLAVCSCSTRRWSCWPVTSASAGGDALAQRVQEQVGRLAPLTPRVVVTQVPGDPVLQGALLTALDETREEVFAAIPAKSS